MTDADRLLFERDFLLDRLIGKHDHRLVGASSDAMVIEAFTGKAPDHWPYDQADLARCERTFDAAPEHLKLLMRSRLEKFRAHVHARERRDR